MVEEVPQVLAPLSYGWMNITNGSQRTNLEAIKVCNYLLDLRWYPRTKELLKVFKRLLRFMKGELLPPSPPLLGFGGFTICICSFASCFNEICLQVDGLTGCWGCCM